jgi:hypothetical protein
MAEAITFVIVQRALVLLVHVMHCSWQLLWSCCVVQGQMIAAAVVSSADWCPVKHIKKHCALVCPSDTQIICS